MAVGVLLTVAATCVSMLILVIVLPFLRLNLLLLVHNDLLYAHNLLF